MPKQRRHVWAGLGAASVYGLAYLVAWSFVWRVPADDRDGLEAIFVFLLTLPWCLLPVTGYAIVHAGALINAGLIALLVAWIVRRRWPATG